jgi:hypothetical protein
VALVGLIHMAVVEQIGAVLCMRSHAVAVEIYKVGHRAEGTEGRRNRAEGTEGETADERSVRGELLTEPYNHS